jgi:transposase
MDSPNVADLRRMYVDEHMTVEAIGNHFGRARSTALRWLRDAGIPTRSVQDAARLRDPVQYGRSTRKVAPPREVLEKMYYKQGRSMTAMSQYLGVSMATLRRWFDEYGIERVSQKREVVFTGREIYQICWLYTTKRWSTANIGRKYHTSPERISLILQENDIEVRGSKPARGVVRQVVRWEERQFGETITGKPLTVHLAILTCGHHRKVWTKSILPHIYEHRTHYSCYVCDQGQDNG